MTTKTLIAAVSLLAIACSPASVDAAPEANSGEKPFDVTVIADFDEPWAMAFVPGTPYALVTEKKGKLLLWQADGPVREVSGVPTVDYGGQGGFGDVILAPDFA